jgi:hypothetical protein
VSEGVGVATGVSDGVGVSEGVGVGVGDSETDGVGVTDTDTDADGERPGVEVGVAVGVEIVDGMLPPTISNNFCSCSEFTHVAPAQSSSACTFPFSKLIPNKLLNQLRMVAKSPSGCGASGRVGIAGAQYDVFTKVSTVGPEESSNAIPMVIPAEVAF